jgi:hypothetical protein
MTERREHPRIEVLYPVLYYSDIYPRPKVASAVDISLEGARIETQYSLVEYEGLDISIAIRPQVIKCRGKVVYILDRAGERVRAGIRFENLSLQDASFLGEHISAMMEGHPS